MQITPGDNERLVKMNLASSYPNYVTKIEGKSKYILSIFSFNSQKQKT
jgi:hypothetical protein